MLLKWIQEPATMSKEQSNSDKLRFFTHQQVTLPYQFIAPEKCMDEDIVIVFLHDALGSIEQWKDFPKKLCDATQLRGFVYEREGHGQATPLSKEREIGYLEDYAIQELPQILNAILPDKQFILFGHSDGGSIALLYAAEFPQSVVGVVTEAAHIFVENITVNGIKATLRVYESSSKLKNALRKYHGDQTDNVFYAWAHTWLTADFYKWNMEYFLHKIKAPSLIIQGNQDEYGSPKQVQNIVQKTLGQSTSLMIDQCGHFPHKDQCEKVVDEVKKFIENEILKN